MQEDQSLVQPTKPQLKSLSELLAEAFAIYKQKFWKFIGMMLMPLLGLIFLVIILLIWSLFNLFFPDFGVVRDIINVVLGASGIVGVVLIIYFGVVAQIGTLNLLRSDDRVWTVFQQSKPFFGKFLIVSFATTIFVLLWSILFIIPGIIFGIYYAFSIFVLMFEDFQSTSALKRSKELVKDYWWPVFFRIAFIYLLILLLSLPMIFLEKGSSLYNIYNVLTGLLEVVITPLIICYLYSIYKNLREIKPEESKVEQKKGGAIFLIVGVAFIAFIFVFGILSSILLVSLQSVKHEGRDAKRVADVKTISTALELYYNDHEKYPDTLESLKSGILSDLSKNPLPNDGECEKDFEYIYSVEDGGQSYELIYCLGGEMGDLSEGYHTATPYGISDDVVR